MEIELPDGTVLEAPDDADPSVVAKNYLSRQKTPASVAPIQKTGLQHAKEAASLFASHPFTSGIGMAENALGSFTSGVGSLADALTGSDPGAHDWAYQPRTEVGQGIARLGGEEAGKAGEKYDKFFGTGPLASTIKERGQEAMGAVGTVTGLGALRGLSGAGRVPGNVGPRPSPRVPGAVSGEAPPAGAVPEAAPAARPARLAHIPEEAPTREALRQAANEAYERARNAGGEVSPESFDRMRADLARRLQDEELDPTLHPSTTAALRRITETEGPVSLRRVETLRRVAQDAEGAQSAGDRRLAGQIVDALDDYAQGLQPADLVSGTTEAAGAFREARGYWSRMRKAQELDDLAERAQNNAGANFTQSGLENALRQQFKALANNQRRMRLFTAEERAAIQRVARGTPGENAIRLVGKLAPTGVVSTAVSTGLGALFGGPVGAAAVPTVGLAARIAATRATMRNANIANELVRRGPLAPPEELAPIPMRGVLAP